MWLKLERVTPEQLFAEVENFTADGWRPRAEIVAHIKTWLAEHESQAAADASVRPCTQASSGVTAD